MRTEKGYVYPMTSSSILTGASAGLPIGSKAIEFDLKGTDGKNHRLDEFKPFKALVVVFSCNHCPYVQAYESRMIQIQKDYQSKKASLVAINSNDDIGYPEDSYENMIQRVRAKGLNFPYLRDETQQIAKEYGAICTPHAFAFDADRKLQYKGRIDDNWKDPNSVNRQDLRLALDAILAGKKPEVHETRPYGCSIKWKH